MALYIPKNTPANWYRYDVQFSLQLLSEYIQGVESQIAASIADFQTNIKTQVVEENPEEGYQIVVQSHKGLDDATWDLNGVYEEYFPNLQRGSALITLYSFFEHELDELCGLFIKEGNLSISQTDMKGKGIERSVLFLEKIIGLQINKNSATWNEIKKIQKVRNQIAHENSKLVDKSGQRIGDVFDYVQACAFLTGQDRINIQQGYLEHILRTFESLFREIDSLIA